MNRHTFHPRFKAQDGPEITTRVAKSQYFPWASQTSKLEQFTLILLRSSFACVDESAVMETIQFYCISSFFTGTITF